MMIICTDLDNTIIYSHKHDIGDKKINVEVYEGKEISYISEKTHTLLKMVNDEMVIIPTTTRTEEQYKRINLKIGTQQYALVCNGGVLLVDGKRDTAWYDESLRLISESKAELDTAIKILKNDIRRKFELRFIDNLFVFTKCDNPENVVKDLKRLLNRKVVNIFNNGEKVYIVPTKLSKGMAVKRIRERLKPRCVIAAGDSEFDVTMVEEADFGLVPNGFVNCYKPTKEVIELDVETLFSESLLERCLEIKAELKN